MTTEDTNGSWFPAPAPSLGTKAQQSALAEKLAAEQQPPVTDPEHDAIKRKAALLIDDPPLASSQGALQDDPQLPVRPEGMTRESFVETGGFNRLKLLLLASSYARQLDRFDSLPVLPNQPLGTDPADEAPLGLILQVAELQKLVTELVEAAKGQVEPCEECRLLTVRLATSEQRAKSWEFSNGEYRTAEKKERQKNETIREELVEVRDHVTDMIGEAKRDGGVEVERSLPPDVASKAPWVANHAVLVAAGRTIGPLSYDVRPLTAANYDLARHCVNVHDELVAVCKAVLKDSTDVSRSDRWLLNVVDKRLAAIIEKAEATP